MKHLSVIVSVMVMLMVVAGFAGASLQGTKTVYRGHGIVVGVNGPNVISVKESGTGYAVGISRSVVMVMRFDRDGSYHVVYRHLQP